MAIRHAQKNAMELLERMRSSAELAIKQEVAVICEPTMTGNKCREGDTVSKWKDCVSETNEQNAVNIDHVLRIEEKLDIISGFVFSLGQLVEQSIGQRPIATDLVLNALREDFCGPAHEWNWDAPDYEPAIFEDDAESTHNVCDGLWEPLQTKNSAVEREGVVDGAVYIEHDQKQLLEPSVDSKIEGAENIDGGQKKDAEPLAGGKAVSAENCENNKKPASVILCRGPGHVKVCGACFHKDGGFGRSWRCTRECLTIDGVWGPSICCSQCAPEATTNPGSVVSEIKVGLGSESFCNSVGRDANSIEADIKITSARRRVWTSSV